MNVSAILYLMNYEKYGRSTASAQYFLQLAGYLGIPVIAWNADNSGLERVMTLETYWEMDEIEVWLGKCAKKKNKNNKVRVQKGKAGGVIPDLIKFQNGGRNRT